MIAATEIKVTELTTLVREFVMHSEKYSVYELNQEKKIRFDWKSKQAEIIEEAEKGLKNETIEIEDIKETLLGK